MGTLSDILLASTLDRQPVGTQLAGAYVDDDGTATIELLERIEQGWRNITTGATIPSYTMSRVYDDVVLTGRRS